MQCAKNLAYQLVAIRSPFSDDDLCHAIQAGLGQAYVPFIRALDAHNADLTIDDLYGLLFK